LIGIYVTNALTAVAVTSSSAVNSVEASGKSTICAAGDELTSLPMSLKGIWPQLQSQHLNAWLKANGGYMSDDYLVVASLAQLGFVYVGTRRVNTEAEWQITAS
jgi:hypothetical protein